jgi:hypothetical protein
LWSWGKLYSQGENWCYYENNMIWKIIFFSVLLTINSFLA